MPADPRPTPPGAPSRRVARRARRCRSGRGRRRPSARRVGGRPTPWTRVAVDALRSALGGLRRGRRRGGRARARRTRRPMLHPGERFGTGGVAGRRVDLVVDPVDGTRLAAAGRPGAMAVLAVAPRGALAALGPAHYLEKLVHGGPDAGLALRAPVAQNLVADSRRHAGVADRGTACRRAGARPRNAEVVAEVVRGGRAPSTLFEHGDVERRRARRGDRGGALDLHLGHRRRARGRARGGGSYARSAASMEALARSANASGEAASLSPPRASTLRDVFGTRRPAAAHRRSWRSAPVTPCALGPAADRPSSSWRPGRSPRG